MSDPLLPDIYEGDGEVDIEKTYDAGYPWIGYGLKVSQGDYYDGGSWLQRYWAAVKRVGGDRYGFDWFRLGYLYVDFSISPERNTDKFLSTIDRAGGWSYGDLIAIDVERGGQRGPLTRDLVQTTTAKIAKSLHEATGIPPICYGGELIRSLGITDPMGCIAAWVADYGAELNSAIYTKMGRSLADVFGWQYCGKLNAHQVEDKLANYPATTPAGLADITAVIYGGGGQAAVTKIRSTFCVTSG